MKIEHLIARLQELQKKYPNAEVRFMDGNNQGWFKTYFQYISVNEHKNYIEIMLDTEE